MEPSQSGIYDSAPLKDSKKWIRLLHVCEWTQDEEPLAFRLSAYEIDKAPRYVAISYTWGDPNSTAEVTVNETKVRIRENARLALWQVRQSGFTNIWIDSICIDQGDLQEKSSQVAMMFDIYLSADDVLACIGPADSASKVIADALPEMIDLITTGLSTKPELWGQPYEQHKIWMRWSSSKGSDFCSAFCHAYNQLFQRPYFQRLWIVQELFAGLAGDSRVGLLVGDSLIPRGVTKYLEHAALGLYAAGGHNCPTPDGTTLATFAEFGLSGRDHPLSYLDDTLLLGCHDPRDRIYGTIGLWGRLGTDDFELLVDYKKSAVDLAIEVATSLKVDGMRNLRSIVRALKLRLHDPQLAPSFVRNETTNSLVKPPRREWQVNFTWRGTIDAVEVFSPDKFDVYGEALSTMRNPQWALGNGDINARHFAVRIDQMLHDGLVSYSCVIGRDNLVERHFVPTMACKGDQIFEAMDGSLAPYIVIRINQDNEEVTLIGLATLIRQDNQPALPEQDCWIPVANANVTFEATAEEMLPFVISPGQYPRRAHHAFRLPPIVSFVPFLNFDDRQGRGYQVIGTD